MRKIIMFVTVLFMPNMALAAVNDFLEAVGLEKNVTVNEFLEIFGLQKNFQVMEFLDVFSLKKNVLVAQWDKYDRTIYLTEKYTTNEDKAFLDSYIDLLNLFEDKKYLFTKITAKDWLLLADTLLQFEEANTKTEWGNLVLKIAIANRLQNLYAIVLQNPASIDETDIPALLTMQKRLRNSLPAKIPVFDYALYKYGYINKLPEVFNLKDTLYSDLNFTSGEQRKMLLEVFNTNDYHQVEIKLLNIMLEEGGGGVITSYQELYNNPAPILSAQQMTYISEAWKQYLLTCLLEDKKFREENILDKDWVSSVILREFNSDSRRWMPISKNMYEKEDMPGYINEVFIFFSTTAFIENQKTNHEFKKRYFENIKHSGKYFSPQYLR